MKSKNHQLNHYSQWKHWLLILTLIILFMSALPSWYGEDPAVQLSVKPSQSVNVEQVHQVLQQAGINSKRIEQQHDNLLVVLDDPDLQTQAKKILVKKFDGQAQVTLALAPAAPDWLLNLGVKPIKLGLDLRGGVQFLLDVDLELVFENQAIMIGDAVKQFVRDQHISQVVIRSGDGAALSIDIADNEARGQVRQFITQQYPLWQVTGHQQTLSINLSENEQLKLTNLTVQQNLQIMRSRIEELGITEALVQRQGDHRIRIELPGVQDPATAKNVIGATASLAFYPVLPKDSVNAVMINDQHNKPVYVSRKPVLGGDHIIDARATTGDFGMAKVNISLDSAGGKLMSDFSRDNIGKPMATAFSEYSRDDQGKAKQTTQIISVATIQSQLGNRFEITGSGSHQEAQQLALLLRAGSMTAPVTIVEERTIGPSLGAENIVNGFAALALGLAVTLLFMACWYRRLGWVANVALIANMVMLFGLLALIPGAVLTLPGIAGLVLTVGMAVDTNVLIFERIKEKLAEGRSFASAIDVGFDSAFSTIFDANFTTMITAVVLFSIGNGPIQGFALTLGLGLLTSMFTGIFASRALINLVYGRDTRRAIKV
ncbi:protein translocase subunit SecD [Shewanella livingstonensis]|uniref:Protein translocase subunit SecD n=1 Tax=Shewanella livingstonensis TaxID=150120 RepID=A0A3G8LUP4_9GAMM|nr:protein translocase subunit SecD [Shewanella livingstonensis]AZG72470.1 protein translocase subunit SecD [Shewanella livingstonensis]